MIDRLRQMAIFAKTIDHGSFRGAARELNLSPSVISHHISQLEEHLGVTLIYRTTRKLTLTKDGERLLQATRNMLDAVEGELLDISGSANEPSGELGVTLPSVLSHAYFTDALAIFMDRYPRIKLSLDYSDTRKALIDDGFDVAVRLSLDAKKSPTSRELFMVKRRLMASTKYLENRPIPLTPKDIESWDWLTLSPVHLRGITFSTTGNKSVKIKPHARIDSNDVRSLFRLVQAGAGIAALPEFLGIEEVKTGRMEFLLPDWHLETLKVYAEWPANAPKHNLTNLFVNTLCDYSAEL